MPRELGVEFAKRGVRVNALYPGPVETPLLRTMFSPDQAARRLVHLPTGRFAQASEIAEAAAFLASDAASYVNSAEFLADGGITAAYVTAEDNRWSSRDSRRPVPHLSPERPVESVNRSRGV
jgi:NAD(P)-dependent dehydrogenase (short-subunit alcohol dehydrogenase family)